MSALSLKAASPTNLKPFIFRLNDNGCGPEVVQNIFLDKGWEEFDEEKHKNYEWNIWWRTSRFRLSDYHDIYPWQRLNHFPKTTGITKKDTLARNMKRMRGVYGPSVFNFTPLGFILPNDYTKFVAEYSKLRQSDNNAEKYWICKPADLSRGRGIFLFKDLSELAYDCSAVVQRYISNPLLIGGYKFDLRVYVVVLSFHPLVIYIYDEGIVRFSTEKFDLSSINNQFSHLTNTSINKLGPSYMMDKERIGPGCKWSFATLRNYFHQQNIECTVLWQRISNIIIYTMLAQAPSVPKVSNCFELFGFDILIDNTLKPWLLEVNFSPALGLDCSTDHIVKCALLSDIIDMLSFSDAERERENVMFNTKLKQNNSEIQRNFSPRKCQTLCKRPSISMTNCKMSSKSSTTTQLKSPRRSQESNGEEKLQRETSDMKASQSPQTHTNSLRSTKLKTLCEKGSSNVQPHNESNASENSSTNSQSNDFTNSGQLITEKAGHRVCQSSSNLTDGNLTQHSHSQSTAGDAKARTRKNVSSVVRKMPWAGKSPKQPRKSCAKASSGNGEKGIKTKQIHNSNSTGSLLKTTSNVKQETTSGTFQKTSKNSPYASVRKPEVMLNTKTDLMDFKYNTTHKIKNVLKPSAKVGDFNLIFPFNEATKSASSPNLDIRTIIRETQKKLRRTMCYGPVHQRRIVRRSTQMINTFAGSNTRKEQVIQQLPNLNMTYRDQTVVTS
ncbi:probable tubulin polyglutamylase TTLL2 [Anneissia japonica]|uniref:probable tubulin polyglutamylase TTLL2 n=1 Tax=Anneissia japonica TaxID=1529436 RepID=UPI00142596B4|nr:probable tubulin polyglutamylase TTLL2 [Anneissia japonica]